MNMLKAVLFMEYVISFYSCGFTDYLNITLVFQDFTTMLDILQQSTSYLLAE